MYFRDRRRSPRAQVRVAFSLSVVRQTQLKPINGRAHSLKGHTRDISAHGAALLLPHIHLEGYHLAAEGREMKLVLELAGESVSMIVMPKRYEKLDGAELGCNYLIGARIIRMEDADRIRYENFINSCLKKTSVKDEQ